MNLYCIWAAAGVISLGLISSAFAHTTTKHYTSSKHTTSHHYVAPKKTWHPSHAAPAHKSSKHYTPQKRWHPTYHKPTYHKPPPPRPVPGIRSDGRYVLPGGMESTCSGGTPPPCQ